MTAPVVIPPAAINQHVAILGKTGSGKTFAAKGIVEHLLRERRQVCVVDPTGAWWGMRLSADGKGKGYDVVLLGGEHADIPLAERSGAAVARLVTEQGASVVIDTSGLTVGEYTRWFIDFADTLYTTIRAPLHLVIDEAHSFMPKGKIPDPTAGKMLHVGNRLMSGGRSRGIRAILITQRPQKLHNDSLTCADTLVAMRVVAPPDRKAVKDWVDGCGNETDGKTVLDSLANLKRGEGWVWYPEGSHLQRVTFPAIATYDSSAAPKHGAHAAPKVGQIDLAEVKAALADAVKEAEANDPKLLRKRIADLQKQLRDRPAETKVVEVVKTVEVPVLNNGLLDRTDQIVDRLTQETNKVQAELAELRRLIAPAFAPKVATRPVVTPPRPVAQAPRHTPRATTAPTGTLSKAERLILTALAQYGDCSKSKVAILAGYAVTGGGFNNALGSLRSQGFIEPGSEPVRATPEGIAALGDYDPLPSGPALLDHWRRQLGKAEREILDVLAAAHPEALSKEETAARTESRYEPTGGGFNNAVGRLRTLELVTGRGELKASDDLF